MSTVFDANLVPLLIAVLIGLITGWLIFRNMRRDKAGQIDSAASSETPSLGSDTDADTHEGNAITDEAAAAVTDIAGQLLGVPAHAELPGASGPPDNLQTLKGVGPKLANQLNALGIVRFEQLARLEPDQAAAIDAQLGTFKGRIARDRLVEQAELLARGDTSGFEATFGKLGSAA